MTLLHTIIRQRTHEGTYLVRLYAVPTKTDVQLGVHAAFLASVGIWDTPVELDPVVMDPIGTIGVEAEGEFAQGTPKFDTLKLGFLADPALVPVVQAMRDPAMDVWCEVTLDQTPDLPERDAAKPWSLWPAQVRSAYWGRLERGSFQGHIARQRWQRLKSAFVKLLRRTGIRHDGALTLEIVHWLKVRGEDDVRSLLSKFVPEIRTVAEHNDIAANGTSSPFYYVQHSWYEFLRFICSAVAPGGNAELIDWRLKDYGQLQIALWPGYTAGTYASLMNDCYIRVWEGESKSPLFDANDEPNEVSFYNWKDLAEALTRISAEFQLLFQIEIPTMADVKEKVKFVRTTFYFANLVTQSLDAYIEHDDDTIDYTPAAAYARQYKVTQPNTNDFPGPAYSIVKSDWRDGTEQEFKTLTRLIGVSSSGGDDRRMTEIYVFNNSGVLVPARVAYSPATSKEYTQWSAAHADTWMRRWGTARSILELKAKGVGLEPFGTSTGLSISGTYGFLDWSAFPLYRRFTARVGLLSNPGKAVYGVVGASEDAAVNPDLEYIVISCKRTPDGGTDYKLIEVGIVSDDNITDPVDQDIDTNPPNNTPPVLKTNDVNNPTQNVLNLKAGTNMALTPDGLGGVVFDATVGGGGVASFNGRTGAVSPVAGDYGITDITGLATVLTSKADASAVVHNTGTESIGGAKTFTSTINGNLAGNVTGNLTGNADTVTNGVYTTGNQTIAGTKTFSSPIAGSITGNAATATKLAAAVTINGVSFDGSGNVTVTAAAGTLTGTTLAAGVTASSLTSVGTIATGVWNGTVIEEAYGGSGWTKSQVTGADALTTAQALVDVIGLTFAAAASSVYEFEAILLCTTSNVNTGTKYGVACSAAGSSIAALYMGPVTSTTGAITSTNALTSADATAFLTTANMTGHVIIRGILTTAAATGNLSIQHLKVTSGTSTVKVGSTLRVRKLS